MCCYLPFRCFACVLLYMFVLPYLSVVLFSASLHIIIVIIVICTAMIIVLVVFFVCACQRLAPHLPPPEGAEGRQVLLQGSPETE